MIYATFAQDSPLRHRYVEVATASETIAKQWMKHFLWEDIIAGVYTEADFQGFPQRYNLVTLGKLWMNPFGAIILDTGAIG